MNKRRWPVGKAVMEEKGDEKECEEEEVTEVEAEEKTEEGKQKATRVKNISPYIKNVAAIFIVASGRRRNRRRRCQ